MATKQTIGWGGTVKRSFTGAANSFTSIPEAKGLIAPQVKFDFPEVTSLDSTGGYREFIKGLKDPGELTLMCGYTPLGYEQQLADQAYATAIYYQVTFPLTPGQTLGDVHTFQGFPSVSVKADDVGAPIGMEITIKITGAPTWIKGAGA